MSKFDGTGPLGYGPLTGRGFGRCRGFGWRSQQVQFSEAEERKILESELVEIEAEKREIEKRLKEMKA